MHNFTLAEQCKIVLQKGALIKVVYCPLDNKDKYWRLVAHKDLLRKLQFTGYYNIAGEYIDILNKEAFPLDTVTIDCFYFCELPAGIMTNDFYSKTPITKHFGQDFLLNDEIYLRNIKNEINKQSAEFLEYTIQQFELFNTLSTEIAKDYFNIRFFPETCNMSKAKIVERIQQDSKQKYFIWTNKGKYVQPVLMYLGLDNSCVDIKNSAFLESFKRVWYNFIQSQALLTLKELCTLQARLENNFKVNEKRTEYGLSTFLDSDFPLKEDELNELNSQISLYKEMIDSISIDILKNCNSVRDIFNTWPSILTQIFYYDDN